MPAGFHLRAFLRQRFGDLRFFFLVTQWDDQHVDMDGIDELARGGHQFAPEILVDFW
jgi:hypothetical protein